MELPVTDPQDFKKFGQAEVGCFFDGARGRYIGVAVIDFAEEHGFDISELIEEYAQLCDREQGSAPTWEEFLADHEYYHELWDDAENHLNTLTEDGFWFGGSEHGDWGLWEAERDDYELSPEDYMGE
jgi:hypothetical protein